MEQYISAFGTGGANRRNVSCAVDLAKDTNGQIEITNIVSFVRSGGSYVVSAIADLTRRDLERTALGIKECSGGNRGWTRRVYLKPLGTRALRAAQRFHADIAEQSSTHRSVIQGSVQSPARCLAIKELRDLIENNLVTL